MKQTWVLSLLHEVLVPLATVFFLASSVSDLECILLSIDLDMLAVRVFNRWVILVVESKKKKRR